MYLLAAITLLFLSAQAAQACSYCGMSMVNLLFPFMWKALWILVPWRLAYLYFQSTEIKVHPFKFMMIRLATLAFLYMGFNLAGFFLYLMGSFTRALWRLVRTLIKPIPEQSIQPALALHATALVLLVPVMVVTYARWSQMDGLDLLREYVRPGTSQSRALANAISSDPHFDIERLRPMLSSQRFGDTEKASEILRLRKSADDLLTLQDTLLNMPDKGIKPDNYQWPEWTGFYFSMWLEGVTGKEIKTKEELRTWITEEEARHKASSSVADDVTSTSATHPTQ